MSARVARIARLLDLEKSRVTNEEQRVATARHALDAAEKGIERAQAALHEGEENARAAATVTDLADASAHCQTLRLGVEAARAKASHAAREVAAREADLVTARIAVRRFEILIENLERSEAIRAARAERRAADEHAARRTKKASSWTTRG